MNIYKALIIISALYLLTITPVQANNSVSASTGTEENRLEKTLQAKDQQIKITASMKNNANTRIDELIRKAKMDLQDSTKSAKLQGDVYLEKTVIDKKVFFIKGVVSSYNTDSFIVNGKTIEIDKTIIKDIKIVGEIKNGMYAIVQGDIINNSLYASNIVVSNRNKQDFVKTITPSVTPKLTPGYKYLKNGKLKERYISSLEDIIHRLQTILDRLKTKS